MGIKMKYRGRWVDEDEWAELRARECEESQPAPEPLDLATLPSDVSLAELGDRCPVVRRYVTVEGRMRSGLKPSEEDVARQILERYGGQT